MNLINFVNDYIFKYIPNFHYFSYNAENYSKIYFWYY